MQQKTASKRFVQKTAEATGDLIGNKIADEITSAGKTKAKEKEKTNKPEEIFIPPEKRRQTIDDLKLFSIIIIIIIIIILMTMSMTMKMTMTIIIIIKNNCNLLYKNGTFKNYKFAPKIFC